MATPSEVCAFCFAEPVFGFCENCSLRLGERCYSNHNKIAIFTDHITFPLDKPNATTQVPVLVEKDIHEQKCLVHGTDPQSFYCAKHDVTICGRCVLSNHMTCKDDVVDLHTTKFDEHKTNELLSTLTEIEGEISELQVRFEEKVEFNDECKSIYMNSIKEYRKKINARLDQLQLLAEKAGENKHQENMNSILEVAKTCKDASLQIQERKTLIKELSQKKQQRHLFIYSKRVEKELHDTRTAIKQSSFKNHIAKFTFQEHSKLENILQGEVIEIGSLQEACNASEEEVEVDAELTASPEEVKESRYICVDEITNPKQLACGHIFCTDCIDQSIKLKPCRPTCGLLTEFNIATAKVTVKPKPVTSPPVTTQRNSNTERAPAVLKPTFLVPTRPPASKNASAVASPHTTVPPATQVPLPHHQSTNEHNHQIPFAQKVYQTTKKTVAILPNRTSQKQLKLVFPTRKSDFKNALVMPISTKETIKTNAVLEKPSTLKSSAIPETTPLAWPTDTIMFRKHDTHNADTTWLPTSTTQNVPSQSAPTTTVTSNVDPLEAANVFDNDGYASDNNEHSFIHNSGMGFYSNSNSG